MDDLYLKVVPEMKEQYVAAAAKYNAQPLEQRDSGFDLFCQEEVYSTWGGPTMFLRFGVESACSMSASGQGQAYWLMPRSSISKTPFMCANSAGLIDIGYRGPLMGAVRQVQPLEGLQTITKGTRLFQAVSGPAVPWRSVCIVDELPGPATTRGSGGFGSTGQ
jgi:dUTP pyrophosphatase